MLGRWARILFLASVLAGCGDSQDGTSSTGSERAVASNTQSAATATRGSFAPERWYTEENLKRGGSLFAEHCADCHGKSGEGAFTWRQVGADGKYPPPPLDGTGHAWHHPFRVLGAQIKSGAPGGQGNMPPFGDRLSDEQIVDVIAWFQAHWSDDIYAQWWQIELRSRQ